MNFQEINTVLDAGKEAAYAKMTLDRNLPKADMRTISFLELQKFLEHEVAELEDEIYQTKASGIIDEELLKRIKDEAGDVIAFASGIAAKCNQEINKIIIEQTPSLFKTEQ